MCPQAPAHSPPAGRHGRRAGPRGASQSGQAAPEFVALVLVVALGLGALVAAVPVVDGRSTGAFLAHAIACAARGGCAADDDPLRAAYGEADAELVRRLAPSLVYEPGTHTLPVDWRSCRSHRCSDAPDDRDLDAHLSRSGERATAFTHVVRRDGETFVQYWLYYPDSTSTVGNAAGAWNRARDLAGRGPAYPGFHPDDWESVHVRIDRHGGVWTRASSHHDYQGCKHRRCRNRWIPATGWSRVSRGSHAGHIPVRSRLVAPIRIAWPPEPPRFRDEPAYPGVHLRERTTSAPRLRLVPLETVDRSSYRPLDPGIVPPWRKRVWTDPTSDSTS